MGDVNYIGSIPLGKIKQWSSKKTAKLDPITFPGKDAGKVEAVDTLGIFETLDFSGKWTGPNRTIQGYINAIKSIADGNQISAQTLKSPFVNSRDTNDSIRFGFLSTNTSSSASKLIDSAVSFSAAGIQVGDIVKNLITGDTATVTAIDSATQLSISSNIFTSSGVTYAVSASINCKILGIETNWELPGMTYCDYKISVVQVA